MRIAMISPYDLSVPGGVQNQAVGLANELAQAHDVQVLAPGHQASDELSPDVDRVLLGGTIRIPVNGSVAPIAPLPAVHLHAARALRRFSPDVVHVHEPFVPGPSLAGLLTSTAPTLGTFHRAGASRPYRALRPLLGLAYRRLSGATAVSDAAADTLRSVLGRPIDVPIYANAVSLERFDRLTRTQSSNDAMPTIAFVGRIEERKGLHVLLDAFERLSQPARLVVLGDGPDLDRLRTRMTGRAVEFLGRGSDRAVAQCLVNADLFVAPSLFGESFGVVLLEAMAARCAVLASDLPGYRLAGGDAIEYFAAGDAAGAAAAIDALIADPSRRAAGAHSARQRAEQFSLAALAARYSLLYQGLVHG